MRFVASLFAAIMVLLTISGPAGAAVNVQINLSSQTMRVTSGNGESRVWAISSGRRGYVTPRGVYRVQHMARMHYSRKYDNAPMPHSIFFRGGYAIHGTNAVGALGRPASHGCIRLAPGNAAKLFAMVRQEGGARIAIGGSPPPSSQLAKKKALARMADATPSRSRADRGLRSWSGDPGGL
jgi:hypothetical protein